MYRLHGRRSMDTHRRVGHNTANNEEESPVNPGFEEVMSIRGRGMPADGEVTISGSDPVFSARFKIGETTANILAGIGVAVTDIHEMKTGKRQKVAIDVRHAAATCQSSRVHAALSCSARISRRSLREASCQHAISGIYIYIGRGHICDL